MSWRSPPGSYHGLLARRPTYRVFALKLRMFNYFHARLSCTDWRNSCRVGFLTLRLEFRAFPRRTLAAC
jgi:hypothetical protein